MYKYMYIFIYRERETIDQFLLSLNVPSLARDLYFPRTQVSDMAKDCLVSCSKLSLALTNVMLHCSTSHFPQPDVEVTNITFASPFIQIFI